MTRKELQELVAESKVTMPYYEKSIERDAFLFKWKSNTPGFRIPYEPEILLTMEGGLGYDKVRSQWVVATPTGLFDKLGDFFICIIRRKPFIIFDFQRQIIIVFPVNVILTEFNFLI